MLQESHKMPAYYFFTQTICFTPRLRLSRSHHPLQQRPLVELTCLRKVLLCGVVKRSERLRGPHARFHLNGRPGSCVWLDYLSRTQLGCCQGSRRHLGARR